MKKFLLKCVLFFCVVFVVFVLTTAIDLALRTKISFELPRDKTVLFIGDSHVVAGVNEKFIPGAFNNAKSADFYLNMFPRIRKLIEANPQIHTIFVATTPYTLNDTADLRIFAGDAEELILLNIPFYGKEELMDSRDAAVMTRKRFRSFERALGRIFNGQASKLEALGGFKELGNGYLSKEIENDYKLAKGRLGSTKSDRSNCNNELTLKYLRKIVEFMHSKNVRIIFFNPPLYHADEFFDVPHFESVLNKKFPDVEFWDYADFPMSQDCFYNVNHLNGKGAEVFSKELARRMQSEGIIAPEKAPNS